MGSFDKWWKKHNSVKETLMREDARYVYESRQAEIDELQKKYYVMYNAFIVADDARQEWHRCYTGVRQREDDLQKQIDDALKELELIDYFRTGNSDKAIKILKGENYE